MSSPWPCQSLQEQYNQLQQQIRSYWGMLNGLTGPERAQVSRLWSAVTEEAARVAAQLRTCIQQHPLPPPITRTGFLPSTDGFKFANNFGSLPPTPLITFPLPIGSVGIGSISNGLCGGMVYAALDFFLGHLPIPGTSAVPGTSDPLLQYLIDRLLDSFGVHSNPPLIDAYTYMQWIWSATHETDLGGLPLIGSFFGGHGLAYRMLNDEWPAVQADMDSGMPSPLGLVVNKTISPTNIPQTAAALADCHQVLAYAYEMDDSFNVTVFVYDPNDPGNDNSTLTFSAAPNPDFHTIALATPDITASIEGNVSFKGFFRSREYVKVTPSAAVQHFHGAQPLTQRHPGQKRRL